MNEKGEKLLQQVERGEVSLMDLEIAMASMMLDPLYVSEEEFEAVNDVLTIAPALPRFKTE